MNILNRLLAWIDRRNFVSVRTALLFWTGWMCWEAFEWAHHFADAKDARSGTDISLIVAAVTGPVTVLAGYVYRKYVESKSGDRPNV